MALVQQFLIMSQLHTVIERARVLHAQRSYDPSVSKVIITLIVDAILQGSTIHRGFNQLTSGGCLGSQATSNKILCRFHSTMAFNFCSFALLLSLSVIACSCWGNIIYSDQVQSFQGMAITTTSMTQRYMVCSNSYWQVRSNSNSSSEICCDSYGKAHRDCSKGYKICSKGGQDLQQNNTRHASRVAEHANADLQQDNLGEEPPGELNKLPSVPLQVECTWLYYFLCWKDDRNLEIIFIALNCKNTASGNTFEVRAPLQREVALPKGGGIGQLPPYFPASFQALKRMNANRLDQTEAFYSANFGGSNLAEWDAAILHFIQYWVPHFPNAHQGFAPTLLSAESTHGPFLNKHLRHCMHACVRVLSFCLNGFLRSTNSSCFVGR